MKGSQPYVTICEWSMHTAPFQTPGAAAIQQKHVLPRLSYYNEYCLYDTASSSSTLLQQACGVARSGVDPTISAMLVPFS